MAGVVIGVVWMVINWLLDIMILLPMNGQGIEEWFGAVGLRYFMMLIMALLAGAVAREFAGKR